MQQQLLESGTSQLSLRVYEADQPARASVVIGGAMGVRQDYDAPFAEWLSGQVFRVTTFDSWRGTQNLIKLYSGAPRSFERITPAELGVQRIGHFGFFREQFSQSLWPHTVQMIERMRLAHPVAGVTGTTV